MDGSVFLWAIMWMLVVLSPCIYNKIIKKKKKNSDFVSLSTFMQVLFRGGYSGDAGWVETTPLSLWCHHATSNQLLWALSTNNSASRTASQGVQVWNLFYSLTCSLLFKVWCDIKEKVIKNELWYLTVCLHRPTQSCVPVADCVT